MAKHTSIKNKKVKKSKRKKKQKKQVNQVIKAINEINANEPDNDLSNYVVSTFYVFNKPDWDQLARNANSLFNRATYILRQNYFHHEKPLSYSALDTIFKNAYKNHENKLYHGIGYVQSAQQLLKVVIKNFKGFRKAIEKYYENPKKFSGKPRIPHCHKPGSRTTFYLTNQNGKIVNNHLISSKFNLNLKLDDDYKGFKFIRAAFVPITNGFKVLVTYEIAGYHFQKDNGIYVSIDPGVDNSFACVTNYHQHPVLINGNAAKATNYYYHKRKAQLQAQQAQYHQLEHRGINKKGKPYVYYDQTKRMQRLDFKHNRRIDHYVYNAINRIVDYVISCNAKIVFIGKNKGWKNKSNMGKKNNQNFLGIPHAVIIDKLKAKLAYYGVRLIAVEESYTSQTSFLDGEKPCRKNGNKARKKNGLHPYKRRITRSLFRANNGALINSDVNGALQIAKKGYSKWVKYAKKHHIYAFHRLSFEDRIKELVLTPYKVNCTTY